VPLLGPPLKQSSTRPASDAVKLEPAYSISRRPLRSFVSSTVSLQGHAIPDNCLRCGRSPESVQVAQGVRPRKAGLA
jgi:hypothetical protein